MLRVGLLGAGRIAGVHAMAISTNPGSQLIEGGGGKVPNRDSLTGVLANSKSSTRKDATAASIPPACRDGHGCASHAESSTPVHQ